MKIDLVHSWGSKVCERKRILTAVANFKRFNCSMAKIVFYEKITLHVFSFDMRVFFFCLFIFLFFLFFV